MDNPGQGQPPQQPYQPPQQPYQPPQQPYQPPQEQYQPPQGAYPPPQGAYQPAGYPPPGYAPPPPAPVKRKGFNWLACCGISCGVLLILGIGFGALIWGFVKPFVNMGMEMSRLQTDVQNTDIATIQAGAVSVNADQLFANPGGYKGQWLAVQGKLASAGQTGTTFSAQDFDTSEMTPYTLEGGVLLLDITKAPPVGQPGDTVLAYGKLYVFDLDTLNKMPLIGKAIEEEMKKDPQLQGITKVVFVLAKQVELLLPAGGAGEDGAAAGGEPMGEHASEWIK
jgi:hypothetical protein